MKKMMLPMVTLLMLGMSTAHCNRKESVKPDDPRNTTTAPLGESTDKTKEIENSGQQQRVPNQQGGQLYKQEQGDR